MKLLIIRLSSIGDIVLTTPVIRCIKKQIPDAEIHFLVKTTYKSILQENPYISRVHEWQADTKSTLQNLQAENFDYVIDLHHNLRTLRIKWALRKAKSYSFHKLNIQKWFRTALKINLLPDKHIVDRYLETVAPLGVKNDGFGLDYFIPKKDQFPITELPATHVSGYIGLVIGAALHTKKLPEEKLIALCRKLPYPIILLGGPEDKTTGEQIANEDRIKIYNACGKFNLHESAWIVKNALLLITHDTGLMHIAAAFHKKIIAVWGNTIPAFGMYPYFGNNSVPCFNAEVNNLSCRPCSKIGYTKCPRGHFKCMQQQDLDAIVNTCNQFLK